MGRPKFQFKTEPYDHQLREHKEHRDDDARALLWQMRTGKSKAIIDLASYRFCLGQDLRGIDAVLIVAPNGVHRNWVRKEFPVHCSVPYIAHAWTSSEAKRAGHRQSLEHVLTAGPDIMPVMTVNTDAIKVKGAQQAIARLLKGRRVLLDVDEVHDFRTPGSKRTRVMIKIARLCAVLRIMTGTSITNSPLGAWSQFEILEHGALGFNTHGAFKREYAILGTGFASGRQFVRVDGYRNTDDLRLRMAKWASVVLREDCEDLPELIPANRYIEPTPTQLRMYRELRDRFEAETDSGAVVRAAEAGARMVRLQQILSNFTVDEDLERVVVDPDKDPRLEALLDILDKVDGKTIVWCRFRPDIDLVTEALTHKKIGFVEYHGRVPTRLRDWAEDEFRENPDKVVLVGQPQAGGVGTNFSAADHIVWYSQINDSLVREQANERATMMGGSHVGVTNLVVADSVDEHWLDLYEKNISLADDVAGRGLKGLLEECRI